MLRFKLRRPSPATLISFLALFVALSGVAYAAALPRNSVGTTQIKKNGVRTSDIKKNAVTGSKIKNNAVGTSDVAGNALTGDDINEGTLGTVPSASTATDTLPPTLRRVSISAANADPAVARSSATEVALGSNGQVSIYGKCFLDTTADTVLGEVIARTTANGSLLQSSQDDLSGNPYLNTGTLEVDRQVDTGSAGAASSSAGNAGRSFQIIGADGNGIHGLSQVFVLNGPVAEGTSVYPASEACVFSLTGTKVPAS